MEPKPNAQEIYERLRSMIMSLQLMPGSRITENQLADFLMSAARLFARRCNA